MAPDEVYLVVEEDTPDFENFKNSLEAIPNRRVMIIKSFDDGFRCLMASKVCAFIEVYVKGNPYHMHEALVLLSPHRMAA